MFCMIPIKKLDDNKKNYKLSSLNVFKDADITIHLPLTGETKI